LLERRIAKPFEGCFVVFARLASKEVEVTRFLRLEDVVQLHLPIAPLLHVALF
jgi:hypothetical protein